MIFQSQPIQIPWTIVIDKLAIFFIIFQRDMPGTRIVNGRKREFGLWYLPARHPHGHVSISVRIAGVGGRGRQRRIRGRQNDGDDDED